MTMVEELSDLADAITSAINAAGLELEPSDGIPELEGGLTSAIFSAVDGLSGTEVTLATVTEVGIEVFDVANDAIQGAELGLTSGAPNAVGSAADLDKTRHGEVSHHVMTHDGHPIGLVIVDNDRRGGDPAGGDAAQPLDEAQPLGESQSPEQAAEAYAPQNFSVPASAPLSGTGNLTMLSDVMLNVTVELGRQSLTLSQVLSLSIGAVVELDRAAGAPVDVRVNGILFGRGEVVVVDDEYAVRVIEILETPGR